jgi:hypothetical protein
MSNSKPKVVVLFGAGASYGSGGIYDIDGKKKGPPLGKDLFAELTTKSPIWHSLLTNQQCVDEFTKGFEHGMDYVLDMQESQIYLDLYPLLKDQANILLDYHIRKPRHNRYWALCQKYLPKLKSKELQFATLNYDCLLEEAISLAEPGSQISYW